MAGDSLTIADALERAARSAPSAIAIEGESRPPLCFAALSAQIEATNARLAEAGIGRGTRVAIVLPNGPEAATATLAVAAAAAAAPLNPALDRRELATLMGEIGVQALVTGEGADSAAAKAANAAGICVLALVPGREAGSFTLDIRSRAGRGGEPEPGRGGEDIALILPTSGTTARPKLVPLSHRNLLASANAVARTLALTSDDRGFNVLPLFHVHGLVASLLAPLVAGGRVCCMGGVDAFKFFAWLETFKPTWFSAVPAIHHAILRRADQHADACARARLRFIRSSSAPLPPPLLAGLERAFACPVIEAYGMTEAAHQIASNPLPPAPRKPGSVGLPAGPEIAIRGEDGAHLPAGRRGEIVIRGPNVTAGYLDNPEANRTAFADGWFRTGDEGMFDPDGYLFVTGRIKEIINRGGEKIAPREVEEVLLAHPAVAEAAAFAVPDPALGEEVGAAVVLKPGACAGEAELKGFAAQGLAYFKVPRHLVRLDAIPKGPTGKIQRAGLAARLGIAGRAAAPDRTPPRGALEAELAALWREVLALQEVGVLANFLDLGGDSVLAAQLVVRASEQFAVELTLADVFDTPTVASMSIRIAEKREPGRGSGPRIARRAATGPAPLSFSQEWWLSLEEAAPPSAASNRPSSLRLAGALDVAILERSLAEVLRRHDSLRTAFPRENGSRVQRVIPPGDFDLPKVDLSGLAAPARMAEALRRAAELAHAPFAPSRAPLWRWELLRLAADDHVLAFTIHHALFDGWSMAVFVRELAAIYEALADGRPSPLPEPALQYADFAVWQRAWLEGPRLARLSRFWRQELAGAPRPPRLPYAKSRPEIPSLRGGHAARLIPLAVLQQARALARAEGATLYMVCVAAFHALLGAYVGEEEVLTGCPVAGRQCREAEGMIGLFFNVLPLRGRLGGDPSFRELLARTRVLTLAALAHQEMPIARIAAAGARPAPDESPIALVPVLFQLRNIPVASAEGGGVAFREFRHETGMARFDLTFDLVERDDGLALLLDYNRDLLEPEDARRLLADFEMALAGFVAEPERRLSAIAHALAEIR